MQHQSAENIFEINTNLVGKEHPPRFHARGPDFEVLGLNLHVQDPEIRIPLAATLKPETLTFEPFTHTALGGHRCSNPPVAPCRRQPPPCPLWSQSAFSSLSISRSADRLVVEGRHVASLGGVGHRRRPLLCLSLSRSVSLSSSLWVFAGGLERGSPKQPPVCRGFFVEKVRGYGPLMFRPFFFWV